MVSSRDVEPLFDISHRIAGHRNQAHAVTGALIDVDDGELIREVLAEGINVPALAVDKSGVEENWIPSEASQDITDWGRTDNRSLWGVEMVPIAESDNCGLVIHII